MRVSGIRFFTADLSFRPSSECLPVQPQRELELARVVCGGWLTRRARGAGSRVAELVYSGDVGTIEKVESVGDEFKANALADGHAFGYAHIPLEEPRACVAISAEDAVAAGWRRDARNGKSREIVGEAQIGGRKSCAGNERRSGSRANGRPRLRSAQIETRILASDDVEWPARGKLDDGRDGEVGQEMPPQIFAAVGSSSLKNGAGDPAVALVVVGIGALEERETAVLRLESGLQVGGVVDGMGPGIAGEQFQTVREALGEVNCQRVVDGTAAGLLGVHAVERNGNAETCRVTCSLGQTHLGGVTQYWIAS